MAVTVDSEVRFLTRDAGSRESAGEDSPGAPRLTLALVIPAHNEAPHIAGVLSAIPAWVDRIFVVDDASTDSTSAAVATCGDSRVKMVRHDANQGVGAAMRTGYRLAMEEGYDLVGKMDGDGQMRADELERLVAPFALGLADYAKGNRFYFRNATRDMPTHRGFGNTVLSLMTKFASGYWHVFDSQCGYTVIRATFLKLIDVDDLPDGYFFENDMLIKLNVLNARVVDVPISTVYGEEVSGVKIGRVVWTFPLRLLSGGAERFWRKHLVTDFGAVGALCVSALALLVPGILFGAYHWWLSGFTGRVATTGTVMVAVLPIIVGLQLGLQAFVLSVLSSPGASETALYARRLIVEGRV